MKVTGQDLKEQFLKLKENVKQMPKKKKIAFGALIAGIVVAAVAITIFLNMGKSEYKTLYYGLEESENTEIYAMLQEMQVPAQRDTQGNITVPAKDYDRCLMQLAIKGYPKSGNAYDLFGEHTGMTATESESEQWKLYQLQENLQRTLKQIEAVRSATVILNVPEGGNYVWEKDNAQQSSASVLLNLNSTLTPEQVDGVKTLVSTGVRNLLPENVRVVDAETSKELKGSDEKDSELTDHIDRFGFEKQVQKQLEDNAERILAARYGKDGVVAVAKVELDYDKMIEERMQLQEKEGGGGFVTDFDESFTQNGNAAPGGIVGEENNTDIPEQVVGTEGEDNPTTDYNKTAHYDYGYIKTQVEKGTAAIKNASISVMVNETNMTQARRNELISLVSTSTGVDAANITVSAVDPEAEPDIDDNNNQTQPEPTVVVPIWIWIVLGVVLLAVVVFVVVWLLLRKRAKRKEMLQQNELDEQRAQMEQEIEQYKKQLSDAAKANTNPKDEAIVNEVKEFAKQNPEITANLLRAWLKEGDE